GRPPRVPSVTGESEFVWRVRIVGEVSEASRVYARNHAFAVGAAADFRDASPHPASIELMLGALGGELASGVRSACARRGIAVEGLELTLAGRPDNPLVALGVVGEAGHAGLASIAGTLYLTADADEPTLAAAWQEAQTRSTVHATLSRCLSLA